MAVDGIRGLRGVARHRDRVRRGQRGCRQVRVDVDRMVQVVTNLLSNAIKFSPDRGDGHGGRPRRAGAQLELRVTDRGPGIAPEDMGRLFRKFQQLDGSNVRSVGGTGPRARHLPRHRGGARRAHRRGEPAGRRAPPSRCACPSPAAAGGRPERAAETARGDGPLDSRGGRRARHARAAARQLRARGLPRPRGGPGARGAWRWRGSGSPT